MTFRTLEKCLSKYGKAFSPDEGELLRKTAGDFLADGLNPMDASVRAVTEILKIHRENLAAVKAFYEKNPKGGQQKPAALSAEGNQSPQPGESAPADAAKDGQATQQGSGTTNVPKKAPRGKRFSVGVSPDGNLDLLNAIEQMGGIRHPDHARNPGGEYDGFKETFSKGLARLLVRRTNTASTPDQLLKELPEAGHKFEIPNALYAAVEKAIEARAKARKGFNQEEYANAFEKAFLGNEQTLT